MITCNGSHIIFNDGKHGKAVYACSLENANKLVQECLRFSAQSLKTVYDEVQGLKIPVRPDTWLLKALDEVRRDEKQPNALRTLFCGPRQKDAEPHPYPEITSAMRDELVLYCWKNEIDLKTISSLSPLEKTIHIFERLEFLAPARARFPAGIRFLEEYLYDGVDELKVILANKWKKEAKEENIVSSYHCRFLDSWESGHWSVMHLEEA